jgi:hypothetical protein
MGDVFQEYNFEKKKRKQFLNNTFWELVENSLQVYLFCFLSDFVHALQ